MDFKNIYLQQCGCISNLNYETQWSLQTHQQKLAFLAFHQHAGEMGIGIWEIIY